MSPFSLPALQLGKQCTKVEESGGGLTVSFGDGETVECDLMLVAVGRGLGAEIVNTDQGSQFTAQAFVDAAFSGNKAEASYNPAYLSEWLKSAKSEEVVLSLQGPDRPLLMSAVDEESGSNLRGLIMPMT